MPFVTTGLINKSYYDNEFQTFIVYGPFGYGKSSFAIQVLNEILELWTYHKDGTVIFLKDNWQEILREYLFFHPKDFVYKCFNENIIEEKYDRKKCIVWDDAGYWLHALDFNDPFVKAVAKYLNVARTDFAAIIFTAPLPTWITRKIRNLPQALTLKVIKVSANPSQKDLRRIKAFQYWVAPDMRKSGVRKKYEEDFSVRLPNPVFDFYVPLRRKYALTASALMLKELKQLETYSFPVI